MQRESSQIRKLKRAVRGCWDHAIGKADIVWWGIFPAEKTEAKDPTPADR